MCIRETLFGIQISLGGKLYFVIFIFVTLPSLRSLAPHKMMSPRLVLT